MELKRFHNIAKFKKNVISAVDETHIEIYNQIIIQWRTFEFEFKKKPGILIPGMTFQTMCCYKKGWKRDRSNTITFFFFLESWSLRNVGFFFLFLIPRFVQKIAAIDSVKIVLKEGIIPDARINQ